MTRAVVVAGVAPSPLRAESPLNALKESSPLTKVDQGRSGQILVRLWSRSEQILVLIWARSAKICASRETAKRTEINTILPNNLPRSFCSRCGHRYGQICPKFCPDMALMWCCSSFEVEWVGGRPETVVGKLDYSPMPTVSFARLERARADPDGKNKKPDTA
eukprot:gene24824-biopygen20923